MILKLKKQLDFDEVECKLELNYNKIPQDENLCLLKDEINYRMNEYEKRIMSLEYKNNELNNKIIKYEEKITILEYDNKKLKEEISEIKSNENKMMKYIYNLKYTYEENPLNLKFCKELTSERNDSGRLCNIDVYIGLKDKIEYLIYNKKKKF